MPLNRLHHFSFTHQRLIGCLTGLSCRRQATLIALFKHFSSHMSKFHLRKATLTSILPSWCCTQSHIFLLTAVMFEYHCETFSRSISNRNSITKLIQQQRLHIVLLLILHNKVLLYFICLHYSKHRHLLVSCFLPILLFFMHRKVYLHVSWITNLQLVVYNRTCSCLPTLIVLSVCSSDEPANPGETSWQWRQRRWDMAKNSYAHRHKAQLMVQGDLSRERN